MKKLAVFFPGIGYTVAKPLMHYSRRIASNLGYEIRLLPYAGFPEKIRGDAARMKESYEIALTQAREMLQDVNFEEYEDILFVGKSIGTVVAAQLAAERDLCNRTRLVFYTPLEETFKYPCKKALVFTGEEDPWVGGSDSRIAQLAKENGFRCYSIPQANHSLESKDICRDIRTLEMVMQETMSWLLFS